MPNYCVSLQQQDSEQQVVCSQRFGDAVLKVFFVSGACLDTRLTGRLTG